jgi:hypothetical protein
MADSKGIHKKVMGKTVIEKKYWWFQIIFEHLPSASLVSFEREMDLMGKVT